jgi:two-component system phosphate regulon sensor histidine kinase PhoR
MEMKNIQRMKKDLVLNASHELRTPLTAVKGYVETLQEGASAEQRAYLKIIERNTDRLIHVVEDLLILSRLERGEGPAEGPGREDRESIRVEDVLQNVFTIFEKTAREKGISLEARQDPGLPSLTADPFQIEQMLINLVDNGIKYTEKGKVSVALGSAGDRYRIEVMDTGIGIPEEHLPLIFERFYVVDKSRSRKLGGTGLGLSIVKHIVQAHGGTISVASRLGQGTTFMIELPLSG